MHEDLIFNAAGRVSPKAYAFIRIEGDDSFDQADGADGQKILRLFLTGLVFLHDMGDEAQIPLDQDVLCFQITLRISLQIISLFRGSEGLGK